MSSPTDDQKLSPFQKAAKEAAAADAAAAGKTAPSLGNRVGGTPGTPAAAPGRAAFGGVTQADTRAPFLATDAAAFLKTQQTRALNARREAERARLHLEIERHKSHIFIKRQELARLATRLRAAESSLVAADAAARRAAASLSLSSGAIHEKSAARAHLAVERAAADRDFERRELAEGKAVEALVREMDKMAKTSPDFVQRSAHYQDLARRKRDRERGLSSIRLERSRRRTELAAKDAALARQVASGERGETDGRRAADLASTLAAKYRLQVHSFAVSKQALDADVERLGQALAKAEAAWRAAERPVAGVAR